MKRGKIKITLLCGMVLAVSFGCTKEQTSTNQVPTVEQVQPDISGVHVLSSPEAKSLLESNKEILILDVRTPQEFAAGHLDQAVNIDFQAPDFEEKVTKLDAAKTYLLYCAAGGRSSMASELLEKHGFKYIYNCQKGFEDLKEIGIPAK
jgi:rhodanese-related sulfurtransferase